jgi:chemosensory pili system protein ChpA (sensor histidine kinase/response regulator)
MCLIAPYILVIDDDDSIRALLRLLLEPHGYRVLLAPDGEVGLALAETHHPDVILLDVAMPRRNGMDVYLDLRHNPRIAEIPVLVLSASLTERDIQTWRGLTNVVDAIMKPFDVYELLDRLAQICKRRAAQAGA